MKYKRLSSFEFNFMSNVLGSENDIYIFKKDLEILKRKRNLILTSCNFCQLYLYDLPTVTRTENNNLYDSQKLIGQRQLPLNHNGPRCLSMQLEVPTTNTTGTALAV